MSALLGVVRRLATTPPFDRLTRFTPLIRLSYALRAALVRERLRFASNELRVRGVTATYTLRESDVRVALRHHTGDVMVLDEIISQSEYELPAAAAARLAGASQLVVADVGANIGLFGAWILGRYPEATVVAFEADPGNAAVHRQAIDANDRGEQWRLIEAFAAPSEGVVTFVTGSYATSHVSRGEEGIGVPSVDLFEHLDAVDLLKIDIEGSEWPLLEDPRFRGLDVGVVVLEYHADGCPEADPAAAAERRLAAAGYEVIPGAAKDRYAAGLLWGVRRSPQMSP